jgi:hypothetical protein
MDHDQDHLMYVSVPSAIIDDLQLSSGSGLVYPKAPA